MTVDEARRRLGSAAESMTDAEVERILIDLEALARLCLDMYMKERAATRLECSSNYPTPSD